MGFFSKMFRLREQDPNSQETTWAFEDNASEILLDAEYARRLSSEFDIDAAIVAHENWKQVLRQQLAGEIDTPIDLAELRDPRRGALGKWLYGPARKLLGKYPAYGLLVARHQYFLEQAVIVVELSRAGDYDAALRVFNGGYRHGSNQVILLLKELKRSLERR